MSWLRWCAVSLAFATVSLASAAPSKTSEPPAPPHATEVAKIVSAKAAAAAGLLDLQAKGSYDGDVVKVTLRGSDPETAFPGVPVMVTLRIEFIYDDIKPGSLASLQKPIEQAENTLNNWAGTATGGSDVPSPLFYPLGAPPPAPTPPSPPI